MACNVTRPSVGCFTVPIFLAPIFSAPAICSSAVRPFSTSSTSYNRVPRGNRDKNKKRGVSAIRSTGPRQPLAVSRLGPLPKPVSDPTAARAAFEVNPNHGLWGFFNEHKEAIMPGSEEGSHGRSWSSRELSKKSWDDLHKLYWTCVKELNIVRTRGNERDRLRLGYGVTEADSRIKNLETTMYRIRLVLLERHYAHFDARLLLEEKYLYQLFPDVFRESVPEDLLGPDASAQTDDVSAGVTTPLDEEVSGSATRPEENSRIDERGQRGRVV